MTLSERTLDYWNVSLAWNQRPKASSISTSDALQLLGGHLDVMIRQRALFPRIYFLRSAIIEGRPTKKSRSKKRG